MALPLGCAAPITIRHLLLRRRCTARSASAARIRFAQRRAAGHQLSAVPARARAQDRPRNPRGESCLRRAPPPARCCPDRATTPTPAAAVRCRDDAARSTAHPARTARREASIRSALPAGCAGLRRRSASPPSDRARCSPARRHSGSPAARRLLCRMRPAICLLALVELDLRARPRSRATPAAR